MPDEYSGFFGEDVASRYDDDSAMFDPAVVDPVVDVLAELAGDGRALELAIGTGRVALPLAARGVQVAGIDDSPAMIQRLRAKPGGDEIDVVIGDFSTTHVPGEFSVVYLVFNTIFNLVTQDAQVACFENAAAHLRPSGTFVIETGVPALQDLPRGQQSSRSAPRLTGSPSTSTTSQRSARARSTTTSSTAASSRSRSSSATHGRQSST